MWYVYHLRKVSELNVTKYSSIYYFFYVCVICNNIWNSQIHSMKKPNNNYCINGLRRTVRPYGSSGQISTPVGNHSIHHIEFFPRVSFIETYIITHNFTPHWKLQQNAVELRMKLVKFKRDKHFNILWIWEIPSTYSISWRRQNYTPKQHPIKVLLH